MKEFSGLILVGVGVLVMILGVADFILDSSVKFASCNTTFTIGLLIFLVGVSQLIKTRKDVKRRQDFRAAQAALEAGDLPNCPVCGANNFSWEEVFAETYRSSGYIRFRSKQGRRMPVLARRCNQCGRLDLFAGTTTSFPLDEGKEKRKRQID